MIEGGLKLAVTSVHDSPMFPMDCGGDGGAGSCVSLLPPEVGGWRGLIHWQVWWRGWW